MQIGVPLAEVGGELGHSSVAMAERDAHPAPEGSSAALARIADVKSRSGHTVDLRRRVNAS